MHPIVNDAALDSLFRTARCHHAWLTRSVSDTLLHAVWELVTLGPVGAEARPARIVFVKSDAAKAKLAAAVPPPLRAAIANAPVAAVLGCATDCERGPAAPDDGAARAGYLILAARALGLDCGPVWRFDKAAVDAACFAEGNAAAMFVCGLGYGDEAQPGPPPSVPGDAAMCTIL